MDFKIYLMLGIGAIVGATLGWLIGDEKSPKKIAAKGVAALMIGLIIIPAFMRYYSFYIEVWTFITSVASVVGVEIILLLTQKLKDFINKIKL
jgi:predicted MFS family arabinose efflux permease